MRKLALISIPVLALACQQADQKPAQVAVAEKPVALAPPSFDPAAVQKKAAALFASVKPQDTSDDPSVEAARVELGKLLYFEHRISAGKDISCNTCHDLAQYGVDAREKDGKRTPTSAGHLGQLGGRNSPTTYNAFVHTTQFWDGRAKDVEEQAKGPVLNPVEMAMKSDADVVKVLKGIKGYPERFAAAFPGEKDPLTYDNFGKAVGAFERKLVTPAPFDAFLAGKVDALSEGQVKGLELFIERCTACHMGPALGGMIFQKLGLMKPYPTKDEGRFEVTKVEGDKFMFKAPSLRNIAKTAPYLHDGSIQTLEEMVQIMAEYQTAQGKLSDEQLGLVVEFLQSLTGELPAELIAAPKLPGT